MQPRDPANDIGAKEDLAAYTLRKASRRLKSATKYYKDACNDTLDGDFDDSANRSYYAAFFAISALHVMDGKSFRRHGQAIGEFNKAYLKERIFDRAYGEALTNMMVYRHTGDYNAKVDVTQGQARESLEMAHKIVGDICEYFQRNYPEVWSIYQKIYPAT